MRSLLYSRFCRRLFLFAMFLATFGALLIALLNYRGLTAWKEYESRVRPQKLIEERPTELSQDTHGQTFAQIEYFKRLASPDEAIQAAALGEILPPWAPHIAVLDPFGNSSAQLMECRDDLLKAGKLESPSDDVAKDILSALRSLEPGLELLRNAIGYPAGKLAVAATVQDGVGVPITFVRLHSVLCLRALALIQLKHPAEAIQDIRLLGRCAESLRGENSITASVMSVYFLRDECGCILQGVNTKQWEGRELSEFASELRPLDLQSEFIAALESERAEMLGILDHLPEATAKNLTQPKTLVDRIWCNNWEPRGLLAYRKLWLAERYDAAIAAAICNRPIGPAEVSRWHLILYGTLLDISRSGLGGWEGLHHEARNKLVLTQAACALSHYQNQNGRYPERLGEINSPINQFAGYKSWGSIRYENSADQSVKLSIDPTTTFIPSDFAITLR